MLNNEIFPPEADITYESFLDKAKQGTASSGLFSAASLVMRIPLAGCHCCGGKEAVAYKKPSDVETLSFSIILTKQVRDSASPFQLRCGHSSAISIEDE